MHGIRRQNATIKHSSRQFSRYIEWEGGRATAYLVKSGSVDTLIQSRYLEAIFCFDWRAGSAVHLELLVMQLEYDFVKRCAGLEYLPTPPRAQTWDYTDSLGWDVARVIYDNCTDGSPGG